LLASRRFGEAALRFAEASRLYAIAEIAARTHAEPAAPVATAPPRPSATDPPPAAPPPATEPVVTTPAPAPSTPPPSAVTPPPPPVAPANPAAVAPAAPPTAAAGPSAEDRITELVGHYKDALEARSLEQLKRWWPSLSGSAEAAIRQEFQHASRIAVGIDDVHITVAGDAGTVTFLRRYSLVTVEGQRLQSTSRATMDVRRAASGGWVIGALRFSPS